MLIPLPKRNKRSDHALLTCQSPSAAKKIISLLQSIITNTNQLWRQRLSVRKLATRHGLKQRLKGVIQLCCLKQLIINLLHQVRFLNALLCGLCKHRQASQVLTHHVVVVHIVHVTLSKAESLALGRNHKIAALVKRTGKSLVQQLRRRVRETHKAQRLAISAKTIAKHRQERRTDNVGNWSTRQRRQRNAHPKTSQTAQRARGLSGRPQLLVQSVKASPTNNNNR